MSSVATKTKIKTLNKVQVSQEQSQKLIQTMLTMSFGCVAFLRGLFPDDSFVDQRFVPNKFEKDYNPRDQTNKTDSIRVKTLIRGKAPQVDTFLDWIDKGATDAIKKGYLKALTFAIFLNKEAPEKLSEAYTFVFSYRDDSIYFSINESESAPQVISLLDSRRTLQQLMKRFIIITQTLDPLPSKKFMSMRLLFNEHCPKDYQPPFFIDASNEKTPTIKISNFSMERHSAGELNTGHHSISLDVLSSQKDENHDMEPIEIDPLHHPLDHTPIFSTHIKAKDETPKTCASQTTKLLRNYLQSSQPDIKPTQPLQKIACECNSSKPVQDSSLIRCASCDNFVHCCCYTGKKINIPITTCFKCRAKSLGVEVHANLSLLFSLRKFYFFMRFCNTPTSVLEFHQMMGNEGEDNIGATKDVLNFLLEKGLVIIESEPRKLVRGGENKKGSLYFDINTKGIYHHGMQLALKKFAWSFIPQLSRINSPQKLVLQRFKRMIFEVTNEKGLCIDDSLSNSYFTIQDEIQSSSVDDVKLQEMPVNLSNLNITSSQDFPSSTISTTDIKPSVKKRSLSESIAADSIPSSQPVVTEPRWKKKKMSVAKNFIHYESINE